MKRSFFVAALVVLTTISYGGTIEITTQDVGGGRLSVGYNVIEGSDVPAGFSFHIRLSNDAEIESVLFANPLFPLCPKTVVFGPGGYPIYGDPVVDNDVEMAIRVLDRPADLHLPGGDPLDLNGDGLIGDSDAFILLNEWGVGGFSYADLNGDLRVDLTDYCILADSDPAVGSSDEILLLQLARGSEDMTDVSIYTNDSGIVGNGGAVVDVVLPGQTTVVVPEPGTLILLGLGALALRRKR